MRPTDDPHIIKGGGRLCRECGFCYICGKFCSQVEEQDWAVKCTQCERAICGAHCRPDEPGLQSTGYDSFVRCAPPCAETPSHVTLEDDMGKLKEITKEDRQKLISEHAYRMWERGNPGTELDHWLKAEADYESTKARIVSDPMYWTNLYRGQTLPRMAC